MKVLMSSVYRAWRSGWDDIEWCEEGKMTRMYYYSYDLIITLVQKSSLRRVIIISDPSTHGPHRHEQTQDRRGQPRCKP